MASCILHSHCPHKPPLGCKTPGASRWRSGCDRLQLPHPGAASAGAQEGMGLDLSDSSGLVSSSMSRFAGGTGGNLGVSGQASSKATTLGSKQLGGQEPSGVTPVAEGHSPLLVGGWLRSPPVPTGGMGWDVALLAQCSQPTGTSLLPGELQPAPGWVGNLPVVLWHLGFKTSTSC